MRKKGRWLLAIGVVLAIGLGSVTYSLFIHSGTTTLTVSELRSQAESLYSQPVRVEGKIASGSINWDEQTRELRFALTDDIESLTVVYTGVVPDEFKPGADLVVEGRYHPDEVFEALNLGSSRSFCNLCH